MSANPRRRLRGRRRAMGCNGGARAGCAAGSIGVTLAFAARFARAGRVSSPGADLRARAAAALPALFGFGVSATTRGRAAFAVGRGVVGALRADALATVILGPVSATASSSAPLPGVGLVAFVISISRRPWRALPGRNCARRKRLCKGGMHHHMVPRPMSHRETRCDGRPARFRPICPARSPRWNAVARRTIRRIARDP